MLYQQNFYQNVQGKIRSCYILISKGTYSCHCKYGYTGDGKKGGLGCKEIKCDNEAGFQIDGQKFNHTDWLVELEIIIQSICKPSQNIKAYGKLAEDGCKALPFGAKLGANGKIRCSAVSSV